MTGFADPISGGTILVQPAIQSPNYVPGVSGWIVRADGSAEFRSIVVPPSTGGATVFIQATAPTANAVGDLWFDSSNGFKLNQWTGTRWQPFQYSTQAMASGGVNADRLVANSITAAQIAAATITATQIAAGTILASNIAANTITAAQIAASTITATQIAAGAITTTQLAANAVTAAKIAANTITAAQIAAGTITATQIAAGTITASLLAAGIVVAGIVDGTTITGGTIIADGTNGEILIYSGTPATGNLIASVSGASGTDAHSNTFPQGIASTNTATGVLATLIGAVLQWTQATSPAPVDPQIVATPAASGASLELVSGAGTGKSEGVLQIMDSSGALGFGTQPGIVVEDVIVIANGGTTVTYDVDANGWPRVTDNNGSQVQVSGSKLAVVSTANVTTTANSSLGFYGVPASDVEVGSSFQGHASGSFSTGASVPTSATFRIYWGGIAGTIIAALAVPTIPANAAGLGWWCDFEANWMTTGSSTGEVEVTIVVGWHTLAGVSNSTTYHVVSQTSSLNTTIAQNLSMAFQWGSAPGGQQLLCDVSRVGRVA